MAEADRPHESSPALLDIVVLTSDIDGLHVGGEVTLGVFDKLSVALRVLSKGVNMACCCR